MTEVFLRIIQISIMSKQEFPDCIGTVDKEKKSKCRECGINDSCESLKPIFNAREGKAAEKAVAKYKKHEQERKSTALGKFIAYTLVTLILLFIYLHIFAEIGA